MHVVFGGLSVHHSMLSLVLDTVGDECAMLYEC